MQGVVRNLKIRKFRTGICTKQSSAKQNWNGPCRCHQIVQEGLRPAWGCDIGRREGWVQLHLWADQVSDIQISAQQFLVKKKRDYKSSSLFIRSSRSVPVPKSQCPRSSVKVSYIKMDTFMQKHQHITASIFLNLHPISGQPQIKFFLSSTFVRMYGSLAY